MAEQQTEATKQATEYVVMRRMGEPGEGAGDRLRQWEEVGPGPVKAANAQAAVKAAAGKLEGTFIAVPARSCKHLTRKIEKVEKELWS